MADPFYETLKSFFFRMRTCGLANYITAILPLRKAKSEGHIDVVCCWSSIAQEEETLRRKIDLTSRGNRLVFKVIVSFRIRNCRWWELDGPVGRDPTARKESIDSGRVGAFAIGNC